MRTFGPKGEEVAGGWRRLHNEELHNLCVSLNIIRVIKSSGIRWARHVARMGAIRIAYEILGGKTEGNRPLRKSRCGWEDNIRMDLKVIV
jgi:hypothetical protein